MKIFPISHNGILNDIKKEFEVVKRIEDADAILLWNDVNAIERGIVRLCKSLKKKTIAFQHGRKGTSKYYEPFNEEISADKLLVWGEFDKERLIKAGRDENKIEVVGTTIWRNLKKRKKHSGTNVVFCPEHWDKPVQENFSVRDELRKLKKVKIITKVIDGHNLGAYDNPVFSNRNDWKHLKTCVEVLQTADVVVGVSESTFELLAQAMDIPVVIMSEWEPKAFGGDLRYTDYPRLVSRASHQATVENLNEVIKHALEYPEELKKERKEVCEEEGGIHLDAVELMKKAIYG